MITYSFLTKSASLAACGALALGLGLGTSPNSAYAATSTSTASASTGSTSTTFVDPAGKTWTADSYANAVAQTWVTILKNVIVPDDNDVYHVDREAATRLVPDAPSDALQQAADALNGKELPYVTLQAPKQSGASTESWSSYGKCVVTGVLGFSPFGIDYNLLGQYVKNRTWDKAYAILANWAKKEVVKQGEKVAAKQILKMTPVGMGAWLVTYSAGCAAKEAFGWN